MRGDNVAPVIGSSTGFPLFRYFNSHFTAETAMLIAPGAFPSLNSSVIYWASSPSAISRPRSHSSNFCRACLRFRIVFSAKDFSTSRAVGSGMSSAVVSAKGTIVVDCVFFSCRFLFYITDSRSTTSRISSKAALIFPFGNGIYVIP